MNPGNVIRSPQLTRVVLFVAVTAAATAVRGGYNARTTVIKPFRADAGKYTGYALNMHQCGVYSHLANACGTGHPNSLVTPGYPLFLAAMVAVSDGPRGIHEGGLQSFYDATRGVQAVLGGLTAGFVLLLSLRFVSLGWALLAAFLAAISPHLVSAGTYVLTETLFSFLLMAALLCMSSERRPSGWGGNVCASVLLGLAAAVRPVVLLLPAGLILLAALRRKNVAAAWAVLLGGVLTFQVAWSGWRASIADIDTVETNMLAAAVAFGGYPDFVFENPRLKGYPYREDPEADAMFQDVSRAVATIYRRAIEEPARYLEWYVIGKPLSFWAWDNVVGGGGVHIYPVSRSPYEEGAGRAVYGALKLIDPILVISAFLGGLATLWRYLVRGQVELLGAAVPIACLLYATAVHQVLAPLPRYSIPFRPLLFVALVQMAAGVAEWVRARVRPPGGQRT